MEQAGKRPNNAEWIKQCEEDFANRFFNIAEEIVQKRQQRIIRLFGPTCSGKTTSARILISLFAQYNKRAHVISIDDFFYSREELLQRAEKNGIDKIDYDSPNTINCDALKKFEHEIFASDEPHEVHCPVFDFKEGRCIGYKTLMVDDDDIFIFEGIQANYPEVIAMLSEHGSASIYIAPFEAVEAGGEVFVPNEIRFLRRLVRDYYFRGTNPEFTFMLWESVRENEEKNIFPYVSERDFYVSSSMPYEIGVLKPYLVDVIGKMDKADRYYPAAQRILKKISAVESIPRELILDGMLYCEFV